MVLYSLIVHLMVQSGYSLKNTCSTISDMRGWFTKSERATIVHHYPPPLPICDRACENQPCERKKIAYFFQLYSVITYHPFV